MWLKVVRPTHGAYSHVGAREVEGGALEAQSERQTPSGARWKSRRKWVERKAKRGRVLCQDRGRRRAGQLKFRLRQGFWAGTGCRCHKWQVDFHVWRDRRHRRVQGLWSTTVKPAKELVARVRECARTRGHRSERTRRCGTIWGVSLSSACAAEGGGRREPRDEYCERHPTQPTSAYSCSMTTAAPVHWQASRSSR